MGQSSFLWGLEINDSLTMELTSQMTVIAGVLGLICFVCSISYNYFYHGASQVLSTNEDKFPDYMEIGRGVALLICLSLYTPIVKTVVGTLELINEATSLTSDRAAEFAQFMEKSSQDQSDLLSDIDKNALKSGIKNGEDQFGAMQKELDNKEQEIEMTAESSSIEKIVQFMNPANMCAAAIHGLAALLTGIIQIVILGIGVVITKVLVILGPFVFALSILPVFEKQLSNWFGTLCSVGFSFTVINILNHIMWKTFRDIYSGSFDLLEEGLKHLIYLGIDLALIGCYCSAFWLASKVVGHGDAGRIISKTVSIVTSAATAAFVGGSIAAGATKATNVGAAASAGKSIINHDQ